MLASSSQPDPVVGTTIDRYRILKPIGEGASGRVYEAVHASFGKRVALKLMRESLRNEPDLFARFQREAESASRIKDPHIIEISDLGTSAAGNIFVVMELLHGRSLASAIAEGKFGEARAVKIIRQLLAGIASAHAIGIVHRDLKPENVFLIERDGEPDFVKILDFGVCKLVEPDATKLTATGALIGTPTYMAPEQVVGDTVDHRADIWAVGVILYEMLAGRPPFTDDKLLSLLKSIETASVPKLSRIVPGLSPRIAAAVHEALAKRRDDRFASAAEFAEALVDREVARSTATVEVQAPPRRRSMAFYAIAAALVAAAGVGGVLVGRATAPAPEAPPPPPPAQPPAAVATLEVTSRPDGAEVSVDGVPAGVTPVTIPNVKPGKRVLRLHRLGFLPAERTEEVRAEERLRLEVALDDNVVTRATARPSPPEATYKALNAAIAGDALVACWALASAATRDPNVTVKLAIVTTKGGSCGDECWTPGTSTVEWPPVSGKAARATTACVRDAIDKPLRELKGLPARTDIELTIGRRPARKKRTEVAVAIEIQPPLPAKAAELGKKLVAADREALLACWDGWVAATGDDAMVVELPLLAYGDDEGGTYQRFGEGGVDGAAGCVRRVLEPIVRSSKFTEVFTTKVSIAVR